MHHVTTLLFRIGGLMIQNVDFGLSMICAFIVFGLGCYYIFMHFLVKYFPFSIKNVVKTKKNMKQPPIGDLKKHIEVIYSNCSLFLIIIVSHSQ